VIKLGDAAVLDTRVVFVDGGDCGHQSVSKLTVTRDSKLEYSCCNFQGCEAKCNNIKYPKFKVQYDSNCDLDCKFYFDLVLTEVTEADVGAYLVEVEMEGVGNRTAPRTITRTFILKLAHDSK
jgi:hypothetical protein